MAAREVMSGRSTAANAVAKLEDELLRLGRNGRWD